ncbi:hypothetical protein CPB86DRAFT_312874 [Serendipita vermifera]|nr:hypothetical protein CPB86DRAFT_312874 [Serendipita vermifera]
MRGHHQVAGIWQAASVLLALLPNSRAAFTTLRLFPVGSLHQISFFPLSRQYIPHHCSFYSEPPAIPPSPTCHFGSKLLRPPKSIGPQLDSSFAVDSVGDMRVCQAGGSHGDTPHGVCSRTPSMFCWVAEL